jgi:hypothetical protein
MSGNATPTIFNYSGGVTTFSVPTSGEFQITAAGGQGGSGNQQQSGGLGATATGVFVLGTGADLMIAVGGMGGNAPDSSLKLGGGGGGGSFVIETFTGYKFINQPLEIAGGGGGPVVILATSLPSQIKGITSTLRQGPLGPMGLGATT